MKWLGIVAALVALAPVAYGVAYPSLTLRYRLTLEAEVDGKPKTGLGVIEVTYSKQLNIRSELSTGYRGEAVMLDLGDRGTLFALLTEGSDSQSSAQSIIFRAFDFPAGRFPYGPVEEGLKKIRQLSGKREVPLTSLPLLVRFRDLGDPTTVEQVDPLDISKSFGTGAKLIRATLEIVPVGIWPLNLFGVTGEPITAHVRKKLNWLPEYYDRRLDGQRFEVASSSRPLANSLSPGAFSAGL